MQMLVFQLHAPLASWGEPAVGEFRPSATEPGESALQGLMGAALGLDRSDDAAHAALAQGYGYAVGSLQRERRGGQLRGSSLLRDYHTAQTVSAAKIAKRPHRTRQDELALPKNDLITILSTREYRQDGSWLAALWQGTAAQWSLDALREALCRPVFTLYLGRKSCPPASPLAPELMEAIDVVHGFRQYLDRQHTRAIEAGEKWPPRYWLERVSSQDPAVLPAEAHHLSLRRKDRVISRRHWLFGDRVQHVALLDEEG